VDARKIRVSKPVLQPILHFEFLRSPEMHGPRARPGVRMLAVDPVLNDPLFPDCGGIHVHRFAAVLETEYPIRINLHSPSASLVVKISSWSSSGVYSLFETGERVQEKRKQKAFLREKSVPRRVE